MSFLSAGYFKFFVAINPDAVFWLTATAEVLGLLVIPALGDLLIRVVAAWVRRRWTTTGG